MKRYAMAVALVATLFMFAGAQAADVTMTWDGGAGEYNDAMWNTGMTPTQVFDTGGGAGTSQSANRGWHGQEDQPTGADDPLVTISGVGSDVIYDAEFNGDWQWEDKRDAVQRGELSIEAGATFTINSDSGDPDGVWMQIDTGTTTVTGAGSLLKRQQLNPNLSGGPMVFGSWNNQAGEVIDLKVLDGGELDNQGQMWFGAYNDSEIDLVVTWEVGEKASLYSHGALENGISSDDTAGAGLEGDIDFIYNYDSVAGATDDSTYAINITGHGGEVKVDHDGIRVQEEDPDGTWTSTLSTYEDLYAANRLQSDGSNAAPFGDKFYVQGSSGSDGYLVRSIEGAVSGGSHVGDLNGDCLTNAIDAGIMFTNFGAGGTPTVGAGNLNGSAFIDAADAGDMFAAWTGDPGPAPAGTATAEYDVQSGEIVVSVAGVVNWFVESATSSLTGDPAANLPQAGGAVSDNDQIIGETTGFISMTYTDINLGAVAQAGLPLGDLTVSWNSALGQPLETIPVVYVNIPEPATLALAALGLCGVLATRRRRMA